MPSSTCETTYKARFDPERRVRPVLDLEPTDVVEPAGYVATATHRQAYNSFTYRIVRNDVIIARAKI